MNALHLLSQDECKELLKRYRQGQARFPLIDAVLAGDQAGTVVAGTNESPRCFFVEHKFGFSQLCGPLAPGFAEALADRLFVRFDFQPAKVRAYAAENAHFFLRFPNCCQRSERQQFRLSPSAGAPASSGADCLPINADNLDEVSSALGIPLGGRFWNSPADFLSRGFGFAVRHDRSVASLCYAAAVADGVAEIDVATTPAARNRGLARIAVSAFIHECRKRGLEPNWDCFTNNHTSMGLAAALGFRAFRPPYSFFTLARPERG